MTVDHYAVAGRRWAEGAALVYGPIARQLVERSPHPLAGRVVLDAGAGTGVTGTVLSSLGARPVACDLSSGMLAWNASPCAVADIRALPLVDDGVDDAVASFVLNHLDEPAAGFAELTRVVHPDGAVLATVYGNTNRSAARDRIDAVAVEEGWAVPSWYVDIKASAAPVLGTAPAMAAAAQAAGLVDVAVEECRVDVGVTRPEQLVEYRLGQAHFGAWLDALTPARAAAVRERLVAEVRPVMEPYRPVVVFLAARAP